MDESHPATPPDEPRLAQPGDISQVLLPLEKQAEEKPVTPLPVAQAERKEEKLPEKKESPKTTKAPREQPTALQEAPGPKADDQLLDLWQKDLDQAMQQPPGRRKIQFSISVVENDRVRYFMDLFCRRQRDFFERALARSGKYIPMMATILQEEGLPEDLVYLSLIESGFSPHAYSRAKALGPWQFIRSTGLRYGLKIDSWIDERRDPVKSTRAAAAYLKDLHLQFGEWFLAAAAYNAGEGKVERAMHRSRTNDFWRLSQKTHLKSETRNYVPKFIAAALIASKPERYGFAEVVYEPPMEYDEVRLRRPLRLAAIAEFAKTSLSIIKELNPALLRDITPPSESDFLLRLPVGSGEIFSQAYGTLFDSAQAKVITHKVKKGETLAGIARRYRQRVSQLMELNGLKNHHIRVGQDLIIVLDGPKKKR
jgi:membrane-bound lytic murein transglycosylase D